MALCKYTALILFLISLVECVPKKYDPTIDNSKGLAFNAQDQLAMESEPSSSNISSVIEPRTGDPRFGIAYTGGDVQSNANSVFPGLNGQLKLDLGGVLLGALVGLGAVIILPKLLHVFSAPIPSPSYDTYGRSEDGSQPSESTLMSALARVDQALSQYNIDSSSCMQRAVCTYVQAASEKVSTGSANTVDAFVDAASTNALVGFMLDGTSFKQAVELGRSGESCATTFSRCPFNKESLMAALKSLLSK